MRLLLVEDEKTLSNALVTILKRNNYAVDANTAKAYASDVLKVDREKGFKNNYKYLKFTTTDERQ